MNHQRRTQRSCRYLLRKFSAYFSLVCISTVIVCAAVTFSASAVAETPPSAAPISRSDVRQITRVVRNVSNKPIRLIMDVTEDSYVPGAVTGHAYALDTKTGKRIARYTRTDLVSVYMHYTDRSHVDVYTVRKVRGRWKVVSKDDWFL